MPYLTQADTRIFKTEPRFQALFVVTSLIGVFLISIAVFRASQELEILHGVETTSRLFSEVLGQEKIARTIQGEAVPLFPASDRYQVYRVIGNRILPLGRARSLPEYLPNTLTGLEYSRFSPDGGYFEWEGQVYSWALVRGATNGNYLLVLHPFVSAGYAATLYAYKQRLVVPFLFYLWLMAWVTVIFRRICRELRGVQDEMQQMALYDALTGLPNRRLMTDRMEKMIQQCEREGSTFACALIDLNGFKAVNDRLGHASGDEVLRQVSQRLRSLVREMDTVARLGGDEFIVLLQGIDEASLHTAFARVQTVLDKPYQLDLSTQTLGASIGVCIYSRQHSTVQSLIHHADLAMYEAKQNGGGTYFSKSSQMDVVTSGTRKCNAVI